MSSSTMARSYLCNIDTTSKTYMTFLFNKATHLFGKDLAKAIINKFKI